jgi:hypothetical protein
MSVRQRGCLANTGLTVMDGFFFAILNEWRNADHNFKGI